MSGGVKGWASLCRKEHKQSLLTNRQKHHHGAVLCVLVLFVVVVDGGWCVTPGAGGKERMDGVYAEWVAFEPLLWDS